MPNRSPSIRRGAMIRDLLLAVASGVLLAVALPPTRIGGLAWIALVPMFRLRRQASGLRLLAAGYVLTLLPVVSIVHGLGILEVSTRFFLIAASGPPLLFAIGMVLATRLERIVQHSFVRVLVFPVLAVAVEYALRWILHGLPVPSLAWSQDGSSVLVQSGYALHTSAPVTFLIVLVNAGVEEGLQWLIDGLTRARVTVRGLAPMAVALLLFGANILYGMHRLATMSAATASVRGDASVRPSAVESDRNTPPPDQASSVLP